MRFLKILSLGLLLLLSAAALPARAEEYVEPVPDEPIPVLEASPEAPAKYNIQVTATITSRPEKARIRAYQISPPPDEKEIQVGEVTSGDGRARFTLDAYRPYRLEAFFPRLNDTASERIDSLSEDTGITLNLDYYHITVSSTYKKAQDLKAAAKIVVYDREYQARALASARTDSYSPADFFLPAHKAYVVRIVYDNRSTANFNGKVLYDLSKDTALTFNNDREQY
jgi:hypothetical protein